MQDSKYILSKLLKPILKNYSSTILIVKRNWFNLIGEKYYKFCEPEKVLFKKNKKNEGVLYIKCFNNVISFYIENNKFFILEKINSIFGYNIIIDIKIKQEPKLIEIKKKKENNMINIIKTSTKNITNQELKEAFKNLDEEFYNI